MNDCNAQDIIKMGAAIAEEFASLLQNLCEYVTPMMAELAASLQMIFRGIARQCSDTFEALMLSSAIEHGIPAKWLYIYRHTKKRRTKKKYRKLIFDAALAFMEAEQ